MSDTKPKCPPRNAEHFEAYQSEVTALKDKQRAEMSPEDLARLDAIEECSERLEAAGVPFILWGSIDPDGLTSSGPRGYWQFNRLAYPKEGEEKYEALVNRAPRAGWTLLPLLLKHCSMAIKGSIVVFGDDKVPRGVYQDGVEYRCDSKEEKSPEEGTES